MSKKNVVPDAWDDDWESQADKIEEITDSTKAEEQVKISKAERLAQHAETNKKIWESADTPETFHFLAAKDSVPLATEFKPTLKVLSRKPAPKVVAKVDPVTGLSKMSIEDDDEDDEQLKNQPTAEELRLKTQREREEKQRRYDEARARILGPFPATSPPLTPPNGYDNGKSSRARGRGRGGGGGGSGSPDMRRPDSQSGPKELFDPNHTPKSGSFTMQKSTQNHIGQSSRSGRSTPREEEQIIRAPKGPDGSGRGGFGFANRGGKS